MEAEIGGIEVMQAIEALQRRGKSISHLMPVIADSLVAAVSDVYEVEGPGWDPLKESTLKQRRGSSAKILQDSGVMAASTAPQYGNDYAEAVAGVDYAKYHSTGTSRMARRDPFDLGPFLDDVLADAADLIAQEAAKF